MPRIPAEAAPRGSRASAMEDRDLALALMAGSPEAFEPFVERFGPLILNFGRRMCGHRDDADEVLQETLLRAYRSLGRLKDPAALKSWVYRVAANSCMKLRRGERPRRADLSLEALLPGPAADGAASVISDWSSRPLERLLRGELRGRLEQAILGLPKPFRIVVVLRDHEGLSTREVARVLGITESLVKVRLHRARLALRRSLDDYLGSRGKPGPRAARSGQ